MSLLVVLLLLLFLIPFTSLPPFPPSLLSNREEKTCKGQTLLLVSYFFRWFSKLIFLKFFKNISKYMRLWGIFFDAFWYYRVLLRGGILYDIDPLVELFHVGSGIWTVFLNILRVLKKDSQVSTECSAPPYSH